MMPRRLHLPAPINVLLVLALLPLVPQGVVAEVLAVRSGEHNGFSRIVVAPQQRTGWTLGRVGAGYELRLDRPGITFDLSRAFDLIPKRRLSALSAGTVDSSMAFGLACDCHAVAFETAGGAIVVDLASGPGNPASGFEAQLEGPTRANTATAAPQGDAIAPPGKADAIAGSPPMAQPAPAPVGSGYLFDPAPFWGDRAPMVPRDPPEGKPPDASPSDQSDPVEGVSALAEANPTAATATGGVPAAGSHMAISNTERDLLFQLSRAATQGLVTPKDAIKAPLDEAASHDPAPEQPKADPPAQPPDRAALRSQTSVDRDTMAVSGDFGTRDGDGAECAPDVAVALASWGDDTDPVSQLVSARSQVVGEFDRPDEEAAVRLARIYLHFGFGAEARATLDAFNVPDDHAPFLREVSWLVDGDAPGHAASIGKMSGCESDVALWAALARGSTAHGSPQNRAAILRSFAALPANLRKTIGPRLADIFLLGDDPDAARNIRNATDRATIEPDRAVDLIDARLDLSAGNTAPAQEILDRLARGGDATARDALILGIEGRLRDGMPVDPILTDTAAALAHENRGTEQGGRLHRAYVLALAANGDYGKAFDELSDAGDIAPAEKRAVTGAIFTHMADHSGDAKFLAAISSQIDRFLPAEPLPELQLKIAGRLQSAGLPDMALQAMDDRVSESDPGRILRARIGLDNFDPESSLQVLAGLGGADAIALRASAYDMAGLNAEAARAYAAAGNTSDGAAAAWRAGDWERAAALGDTAMQDRLKSLGLVPSGSPNGSSQVGQSAVTPSNGAVGATPPGGSTSGGPTIQAPSTLSSAAQAPPAQAPASGDPNGPLANARNLIGKSQDTRNGISDLLKGLP